MLSPLRSMTSRWSRYWISSLTELCGVFDELSSPFGSEMLKPTACLAPADGAVFGLWSALALGPATLSLFPLLPFFPFDCAAIAARALSWRARNARWWDQYGRDWHGGIKRLILKLANVGKRSIYEWHMVMGSVIHIIYSRTWDLISVPYYIHAES